MKEKLLNNIGLKILSIFLAFFVWLVVVNVSNPEVSNKQTVSVEITNGAVLASENLTYEISGKDTVTISYKVRYQNQTLINASDFHAYIDLADYNVTGAVPVKVDINPDKERLIDGVTVKPMVLKVKTEELQRKRFELKVNTKGTPEEGYVLGATELSPAYVFVNGPVSQVGQISEVGIEVDVDGAVSDLSGTTQPIFYDANGNKVETNEKVYLNITDISYKTTLLKVKNLGLVFDVQGQVAAGYRFTGVECETKSIPVVGMKSVLASLSTITIPSSELDLSGATSDKVVSVDVSDYLPPSAAIAGEADSRIKVVLKVEQLKRKDFTIDIKDIPLTGTSEDYEYTFDKETVTVTVEGLLEDLDKLEAADLHAAMEVSGVIPGVRPASLTFNVGEGFGIVGYTGFNMTVTAVGEETSPAEASTVNATAGEPTTAGGETETPGESE